MTVSDGLPSQTVPMTKTRRGERLRKLYARSFTKSGRRSLCMAMSCMPLRSGAEAAIFSAHWAILFATHGLDLLRELLVAFEHLLDGLQHLRVIEVLADVAERIFGRVDHPFGLLARNGFDTAHTGRNGALRKDLEEADGSRRAGMRTAAQLDRIAETDHADAIAVLLAEEHHGSGSGSLFLRGVTLLLERIVGAHGAIDQHSTSRNCSGVTFWK